MIAMRYGAVPLVRRTGGLRDTVFDVQLDPARAASYGKSCNGYNFDGEHEQDIEYALKRALDDYFDREKWNQMNLPSVGMRQDWSWTAPSERYIDLYWNARRKANRQQ
jgi:glycogen synthase